MNRIKEAIGLYNQQHLKEGEEKMTQKRLAEIVLYDHKISSQGKQHLVFWWVEESRKMSLKHLRRVCVALKCDPAYIVGL